MISSKKLSERFRSLLSNEDVLSLKHKTLIEEMLDDLGLGHVAVFFRRDGLVRFVSAIDLNEILCALRRSPQDANICSEGRERDEGNCSDDQ